MEKAIEQIEDFVTKYKINPENQFKKILEEIEEYKKDHDPKELADIVISCIGYGLLFNSQYGQVPDGNLPFGLLKKFQITQEFVNEAYEIAGSQNIDLTSLIKEKVEVNANRTWETQENGTLHHV